MVLGPDHVIHLKWKLNQCLQIYHFKMHQMKLFKWELNFQKHIQYTSFKSENF